MKKTAVIIVAFNGMQWIEKCISSVMESSFVCEIIIVDNNSNDGTTSYIKSQFSHVILLEQTKNLGFGVANNIGMTYALNNGADYVFLLNQDAYIQVNTIKRLMEVFNSNPEYGIISPIHLNGAADKLDKNFSNYIKVNDTLFFDALKGVFTKNIYDVSFVNAAAWFMQRKTLETIGGFDPIFHHYSEDDNYCQRLQFHGFKIGVVPTCFIQHDREFRFTNNQSNIHNNLVLKERYLKHIWANINIEVAEEIRRRKRYLTVQIISLSIKLKFRKAIYYKKERALIKKITPEIFKSRSINSEKGCHYL